MSMVPNGWRSVRLGDIAQESRRRNVDLAIEGDRLYGVFKGEGMIPMRDRVRGASIERCKIVSHGAFAYNPMRLNIGSIALWAGDEDVIVSPDYVVFKCDPSKLHHRYLDYIRESSAWMKFTERSGDGGVRVRIYFDDLAEFRFSLPPLPEQYRIVETLASVDEAISATKKVIEQSCTVRQGALKRLLTTGIDHGRFKQTKIGKIPTTWDLVSLESLLANDPSSMRSGPFGSVLKKEELVDDGIPFLGIDNVHVEQFSTKFKRFVSQKKFEELKRYAVRSRDVMITIMGTVGRCCTVPEQIGPALSSKHIWTMTFDQKKYVPELVCWQLNFAPWVISKFSQVTQGGVMGAINSQILKALLLPKPPLIEQLRFFNILKNFNEVIKQAENELEALQQAKSALLSDLLSGRKRVPMAEHAPLE